MEIPLLELYNDCQEKRHCEKDRNGKNTISSELKSFGFQFSIFEKSHDNLKEMQTEILHSITLKKAIKEAKRDTGTKYPHFDLLCEII